MSNQSPPNPTMVPAYTLVHHSGKGAFVPQVLSSPVVMIGRVPGNDVVLPSLNVSRRHAKLYISEHGVTAHDLDSYNGMFVNGRKVRSAPLKPGDLLYVGDVCVRLEPAGEPFGKRTQTGVLHVDVSDEEDPAQRALAALSRVSSICAQGTTDGWLDEVMQVCVELLEASLVVFVEVHEDGDFHPAVTLPRPVSGPPPSVLWSFVQKAVAGAAPLYTRSLDDDPVVDEDLRAAPHRAVMAVPVVLPQGDRFVVVGVLYAARSTAGLFFGDPHFDTLQAIARLVGLRTERDRATTEPTSAGGPSDTVQALQRIAELEELLAAQARTADEAGARVAALEAELGRARRDAGDGAAAQKQAQDLIARHEAALNEARRNARAEADTLRAERDDARAQALAADNAQRTLLGDQEQNGVALADLEEKLRAARADASAAAAGLAAAGAERDGALARLAAAIVERDGALARLAAAERELGSLRGDVDAEKARGASADALRNALRASVPPMLVDHVEAVAAGAMPTTTMKTRSLTALYVGLSEFDAFCEQAAPDIVRVALDRFCSIVAERAGVHGGRVQQVVGHAHLVVFGADGAGAAGAVRCALEVDDAFGFAAGQPCVVAGVHNGSAVTGFFGGRDATSFVEAGAPVVVARAACEHAPQSGASGAPHGVVVSESVRSQIASESDFRITRLGPTWIPGVRAAISLSVVERAHEDAA